MNCIKHLDRYASYVNMQLLVCVYPLGYQRHLPNLMCVVLFLLQATCQAEAACVDQRFVKVMLAIIQACGLHLRNSNQVQTSNLHCFLSGLRFVSAKIQYVYVYGSSTVFPHRWALGFSSLRALMYFWQRYDLTDIQASREQQKFEIFNGWARCKLNTIFLNLLQMTQFMTISTHLFLCLF